MNNETPPSHYDFFASTDTSVIRDVQNSPIATFRHLPGARVNFHYDRLNLTSNQLRSKAASINKGFEVLEPSIVAGDYGILIAPDGKAFSTI